jgi:putative Holliday junction resolvase
MNRYPDLHASTILALDFGLRRIGIASANTVTATATALTTLPARDGEPDWLQLDQLIGEWEPDLLVLGLPYNADGSESDMTQRVRSFEQQLEQRYSLKVALTDERYSSAEAESLLKSARQAGTKNKRITKEDVDSLAARLIAERWLRQSDPH